MSDDEIASLIDCHLVRALDGLSFGDAEAFPNHIGKYTFNFGSVSLVFKNAGPGSRMGVNSYPFTGAGRELHALLRRAPDEAFVEAFRQAFRDGGFPLKVMGGVK